MYGSFYFVLMNGNLHAWTPSFSLNLVPYAAHVGLHVAVHMELHIQLHMELHMELQRELT